MFLTAILIIVIMGLYVIFNRGNSIIYTIPMYFFCIAAMLITAVLYMSKVEVYRFTSGIDYTLYLMMQRIRINITDVSLMYNFCIAAFMMCSVVFAQCLMPHRKWIHIILIFPIVYFFIWNAPSVSRDIFVAQNTDVGDSIRQINRLIAVSNRITAYMPFFYMLWPFVEIVAYFRRTQIPTKKKICVMIGVCIALIDVFVYINFIKGELSPVWFSNVDASKIPRAMRDYADYTFSSSIILSMLVAVLLFTMYYNPFYSLKKVKKREMRLNAKLISENTFMMFHVYKNAFFAVGQQLELVKLSCSRDNTEKALASADKGLDIVESYMGMLNRTLELFKNNSGLYVAADIAECINEAWEKVNAPDNINFEKSFGDVPVYVLCNKLHMVEVFVNLFKNAAEAMETRQYPSIKVSIVNEEDLCMIIIRDNGCGIKRENLKKIFAPFYSSKVRAKSSGIGLSYVQKVIKQHHGDIIVKSEFGEYTEFKVVLQKYAGRKERVYEKN